MPKHSGLCLLLARRLATAECALSLNAKELGQHCLDDPLCTAILYKPGQLLNYIGVVLLWGVCPRGGGGGRGARGEWRVAAWSCQQMARMTRSPGVC